MPKRSNEGLERLGVGKEAPGEGMRKVTLRLPKEMIKVLAHMAVDGGITRVALVRELLTRAINEARK